MPGSPPAGPPPLWERCPHSVLALPPRGHCVKNRILQQNRMKALQRLPQDRVCRVPNAGPARPCPGGASVLLCPPAAREQNQLHAWQGRLRPAAPTNPSVLPSISPIGAARSPRPLHLISSLLARPQLAFRAPTGRIRGAGCSRSRGTPSSPCGCPRRSPSGKRSAGSARGNVSALGCRHQEEPSAPLCRTSAMRWSSSTGTNLSCMPCTSSTGTASSAWYTSSPSGQYCPLIIARSTKEETLKALPSFSSCFSLAPWRAKPALRDVEGISIA